MNRALRWIVALGSALFILTTLAYVHPEFIYLVLVIPLFLALIVIEIIALWVGATKWRKVSRLWLSPALVCLGFIFCMLYFASPIGRDISDRIFLKRRGSYVRIVDKFRKGLVQCTRACNGDLSPLDALNLPPNVSHIYGIHCDAGIAVLFSLKTDVPLLHTGYMFKDYAENDDCGAREFVGPHLPFVRQVTGKWYRFSDEPGF